MSFSFYSKKLSRAIYLRVRVNHPFHGDSLSLLSRNKRKDSIGLRFLRTVQIRDPLRLIFTVYTNSLLYTLFKSSLRTCPTLYHRLRNRIEPNTKRRKWKLKITCFGFSIEGKLLLILLCD